MGIGSSGLVIKTADGNLSTAGKPVRVFSVSVLSATTLGVDLYNGTSVTGSPVISLAGVAAHSNTESYPNGILFYSGCYVDLLGATQAAIECRLEL